MWRAARLLVLGLAGLGLALASAPALGSAQGVAGAHLTASYLEPLPGKLVTKASKASRSASLSPQRCWTELSRRKLGVTRWKGFASGVATPVRVTGDIAGVRFVTPGRKSPYGILDCRLALELAELSEVLLRHDVVQVNVDNMYRPRARLPGRKKPSQHSYGLAIDMTRFKLKDGSELVIERDFQGAIGEPVCGSGARASAELPDAARKLRNLICEVARLELFHHILTPNHDAA
ncbi:MAG: extensin family protein, partial [Actinomycetota bacterium]|nr:extensin family protein [Actinomycetota bacterium]